MSTGENKDIVGLIKKENGNVLESVQSFVDTNIRVIQVIFMS